ncbi:ChaB family protein [Gloeothece verrucosa]|uniref:General stress protein 17M-like domain-containing protein n=1 Tax=Gloeothece verrucosa (strain PCC 7822) TaxID=497965 RepID=E0UJX9_GLOV7|nr:ChaB family protein [Gloeothece verrucosa]ADN14615.1 conserved hypothetical protein [Gloeothece verrucosa PCC 7822]
MAENNQQLGTVTAVYKSQEQVEQVVRRLLDRGIDREHISVMGKNFESQTRIAGFISKRDLIFGGLRSGAIFGSLFGSLLSLFTGVGVLFIPFVGTVVAAGPISALLLGAATGAIAGSAGAGLASFLGTLGMPEDKAAVYQTRLQAGEYLVMVEVPSDQSGEYSLLMESAGGEEVHVLNQALSRPCAGRCNSPEDLSPEIRAHLSQEAQQTFIEEYNKAFDEANDEAKAEQAAISAIHQKYGEDENGVWSKVKVEA